MCVTNSQVTIMNVIIAASTMAWSLEITQLYQIDPQKVDHQKFSYQYYIWLKVMKERFVTNYGRSPLNCSGCSKIFQISGFWMDVSKSNSSLKILSEQSSCIWMQNVYEDHSLVIITCFFACQHWKYIRKLQLLVLFDLSQKVMCYRGNWYFSHVTYLRHTCTKWVCTFEVSTKWRIHF